MVLTSVFLPNVWPRPPVWYAGAERSWPPEAHVDPIPDEQLARTARDGDRDALGELLGRHRQRIFALCYRILARREDALDATQEACLRVCRHIRSFDPKRSFWAWLRQVAVRSCLDLAGQRRRRQAREPGLETTEQHDPGQDPQRDAAGRQIRVAVAAALEGLTPAQRTAFVCRELEGMDTLQIAKALGCLRATVRWHLFEARKNLAKRLEPFAGG